MSEHNYLGMAFKAELEKNPDFMTIDIVKIEAAAKKVREERAAQNPPKAEPIKLEFNHLRKALYDLQQDAKGTEVRLNDASATVQHFEVIVADMLKKKKAASNELRLGDERGWEHRLLAAECDLQTAREDLVKWQRLNTGAARELRTFDDTRLKELEKLV